MACLTVPFAIAAKSSLQYVPAEQQAMVIMWEEDAFYDGERVQYLNGRQRAFHFIRE